MLFDAAKLLESCEFKRLSRGSGWLGYPAPSPHLHSPHHCLLVTPSQVQACDLDSPGVTGWWQPSATITCSVLPLASLPFCHSPGRWVGPPSVTARGVECSLLLSHAQGSLSRVEPSIVSRHEMLTVQVCCPSPPCHALGRVAGPSTVFWHDCCCRVPCVCQLPPFHPSGSAGVDVTQKWIIRYEYVKLTFSKATLTHNMARAASFLALLVQLCSNKCTNVVLPGVVLFLCLVSSASVAPLTSPATRRWPLRFSALPVLWHSQPRQLSVAAGLTDRSLLLFVSKFVLSRVGRPARACQCLGLAGQTGPQHKAPALSEGGT